MRYLVLVSNENGLTEESLLRSFRISLSNPEVAYLTFHWLNYLLTICGTVCYQRQIILIRARSDK